MVHSCMFSVGSDFSFFFYFFGSVIIFFPFHEESRFSQVHQYRILFVMLLNIQQIKLIQEITI